MCLNGNHYTRNNRRWATTRYPSIDWYLHILAGGGTSHHFSPSSTPTRDSVLWRMPKCFYSIHFARSISMMNFNVSLFHFGRLWTPKWMRNVEVFHSCSETIVSHFDAWQAHWNCWLGPSISLWIASLDLNPTTFRAQNWDSLNIVFGGKIHGGCILKYNIVFMLLNILLW